MAKKPTTPDSPEARLQEMRDRAAHAREVRQQALAKKKSPACHPERPQVGTTGLCHECYVGSSAAKSLSIQDALKLAERHADPAVALSIRTAALAILVENLPEYARMHFEASKMAALKGDAKPAEWALTMIKSASQPAVVDLPKNAPVESGVRIFVGVKLGGLDRQIGTSNPVDAEVVPVDVLTS